MKFEKQQKHVTYVESDDIYRVSWDSVFASPRTIRDPSKHLVGIAAAVMYWDSVDRRNHCLGCARTINESWKCGDRYLLDTDEARRDAELVSDLSSSRPDDNDICSALSDLQNAISMVRLNDLEMDDFEVLPACTEAISKCMNIDGFNEWTPQAKRRRFLYELSRKDRTSVVYTLMGLYFGYGSTPIVTSRQKQELLSFDRGEGVDGAISFFDNCLRTITGYRYS